MPEQRDMGSDEGRVVFRQNAAIAALSSRGLSGVFKKVLLPHRMSIVTACLLGGVIGALVAGLLVSVLSQYQTSKRNQFVQVAVFALTSAASAYLLCRY